MNGTPGVTIRSSSSSSIKSIHTLVSMFLEVFPRKGRWVCLEDSRCGRTSCACVFFLIRKGDVDGVVWGPTDSSAWGSLVFGL